ncbi:MULTISPECIES: hypothetical protein [unclassified Spirillospora]|uniref:hypothetical protein n=1 Tax=unclassified Spirillospora TaxID=2642701 RepID=UPI00371FF814
MNDKADSADDKATGGTEREREKRPPRTEGEGQKRKPGDAARKMREMFKGQGLPRDVRNTPREGGARSAPVE